MNERYGLKPGQRVGAVVLAGGLARRMGGQDKGLVSLAGQPMISYATRTLAPLVDSLVINANRNQQAYEQLGLPVISDRREGHLGPLSGLSSALHAMDTDYVFMCPCDSPFIQGELFAALLSTCLSSDSDVAVPHDGQRLQPVFCLVHRRVEDSLNAFLDAGERKIDRWFEQLAMSVVPAEPYANSFLNINTEEERLAAEKGMHA